MEDRAGWLVCTSDQPREVPNPIPPGPPGTAASIALERAKQALRFDQGWRREECPRPLPIDCRVASRKAWITLRFGCAPTQGDPAGRIAHPGGPSDTAATGRERLTIERMRTPTVWSVPTRSVDGDRDPVRVGAGHPTGALTLVRLTATMSASNAPIHRLSMGLGAPTRLRYVRGDVAETTIDLVGQRIAAWALDGSPLPDEAP